MKFVRLSLWLSVGVAVVAGLSSCSTAAKSASGKPTTTAANLTNSNPTDSRPAGSSGKAGSNNKPMVVASFYPLAFVAERLVGDVATVVNLTPPGVEPHDLEVSPDQAATIEDAKLVLTMGQGLQPSVEDAAKRRSSGVLSLLDLLGVPASANTKRAEESFDVGSDPHVWLDPQLMQNAVAEIATALAKVFPDSIDDINIRSTELGAELRGVDAAYVSGLAGCKGKVIVTSHAAFGRLAERFFLRQESIVGVSPEAEPTADRLATLADLVKSNRVTTIFAEELVSPKVADTLARETGVTVAVLNPIEGAPKQGDYVSAMIKNLAVLRAGLAC
jgi:zinc transport system substrate-binding protein